MFISVLIVTGSFRNVSATCCNNCTCAPKVSWHCCWLGWWSTSQKPCDCEHHDREKLLKAPVEHDKTVQKPEHVSSHGQQSPPKKRSSESHASVASQQIRRLDSKGSVEPKKKIVSKGMLPEWDPVLKMSVDGDHPRYRRSAEPTVASVETSSAALLVLDEPRDSEGSQRQEPTPIGDTRDDCDLSSEPSLQTHYDKVRQLPNSDLAEQWGRVIGKFMDIISGELKKRVTKTTKPLFLKIIQDVIWEYNFNDQVNQHRDEKRFDELYESAVAYFHEKLECPQWLKSQWKETETVIRRMAQALWNTRNNES